MRAAADAGAADTGTKKKVVVVGAGWAGLGAAHHLTKQGYSVDILEASPHPGGLVAGWTTAQGKNVEVGIHGFWYPYRNIFKLVDELNLRPFTNWTRSNQYSPAGLEVSAPVYQDLPRLPTPLGAFVYPTFHRLPLADRMSALPLLQAAADWDNSDEAWERYGSMTARELFRSFGVTERLYKEAFEPMLLVGLFAPGERCSAAAALGMLSFFILGHQPDFDVVWCKGTTRETILNPWLKVIESRGGELHAGRRVSDVEVDAWGRARAVLCDNGERFEADAVVFAVSVGGLKKIVASSSSLRGRQEFRKACALGGVDVAAIRLYLDRKVNIPAPSNACFGFEPATGMTFFDLNELHEEHKGEAKTVVEVDLYGANQYMAMPDAVAVAQVKGFLETCVPEFAQAQVEDSVVVRFPGAVTHFTPGCQSALMRARTSIPNLYMAGDWILTESSTWSQEKAYVTGLEAANLAIEHLGEGVPATVVPLEPDEPHVVALRTVTRAARKAAASSPFASLLPAVLK